AVNVQAVLLSDHKIVVTMTGRRVHTAGARFSGRLLCASFADIEFSFSVGFAAERDMLADHQQRWSINPGMTAFEAIELRASETSQNFRLAQAAFGGHRIQKFSRNNVDF